MKSSIQHPQWSVQGAPHHMVRKLRSDALTCLDISPSPSVLQVLFYCWHFPTEKGGKNMEVNSELSQYTRQMHKIHKTKFPPLPNLTLDCDTDCRSIVKASTLISLFISSSKALMCL